MSQFNTGMGEWTGSFQPVAPIRKAQGSVGGDVAGALAQVLPNVLQGMGKGYARAEGAEIRGEGITQVEAERSALGFQEATANTQGMTNAEIADMKSAALKKFGTDDKRLQALVSSGQITTLEANARRQSLIQENLSNPILSMFSEDFINAAAPYTGGTGKLAEQFFGAYQPTMEEQVMLKAQASAVETAAAKEQAIQSFQSEMGWSREESEQYYYEANKKALDYNNAKQNFEMLKFGSPEVFNGSVSLINSYSNSVGGKIASLIKNTGSLTPDQIAGLKGELSLGYNRVRKELEKFGSKMNPSDYTAAITQLDNQQKKFDAMITDQSQIKALESAVSIINKKSELLSGQAAYKITSNFPSIVAAFDIDPKFGETYVGIISGDLSARYQASTNPYYKKFYEGMRSMDINNLTETAYDKTMNGGEISSEEAKAYYLSMTQPNSAIGTKRALDAGVEGIKTTLQTVFKDTNASLSLFNDVDEWSAVLATGRGKDIAVPALKGAATKLRAMQIMNIGDVPPQLAVREVTYEGSAGLTRGAGLKRVSYEISTGGVKLDDTVKKELVQMYKIISKNPQLVKAFGVDTPEEMLTKVLTTGLR